MTNYRYLGYGVTDSNGVAKLDHNSEGQEISHSYTGVGAGEIDVVASLDNPVSQGSIVSGTFSVFDCYKKDTGMSDYTNIWSIANATLSRDGGYSTITETTTGTTGLIGISNVSLINYRIEVDVYQVDGTQDEWCLNVLNADYTTITSADAKLGEWKHISLDLTNIAPNSRVRLNTGGSCTELRFKNFMLYPYGDTDVISINASNPVIQSTETTDITGSLFFNGVLQKNTNIDVYKNGTKIDTISTGSTGVASYTYTGSGAGATEFQFKYGSIVSETYSIDDCSYLDTFSSDTKNKYYYENGSVNISDGALTFTGNSDGAYLNLSNANMPNISNYQGRTVYFKADVLNLPDGVTVNMRIYQTVNGSTTSTYTEYQSGGTLEHHREIDASASSIICRIQFIGVNGKSVVFDNYRIV